MEGNLFEKRDTSLLKAIKLIIKYAKHSPDWVENVPYNKEMKKK